jgi:Peptidase family M48
VDLNAFLPLLLPLAAWPVSHYAAPKLPPRFASWLLGVTGVTLAVGSTATLLLLTFAGLSAVPPIAGVAAWPITVSCGLALVWIGGSTVWTARRYQRWSRGLHSELDTYSREPGVIVLPMAEPLAVAVPGRGGRIAISRGMLAVLNQDERCALLAHERTHLRCRHYLFLAAIALAGLLNPLIRPLRPATVYSLERWADEVAAERVGDRKVVASAVAKAALASGGHTSFALAATGGPVPQRVSALLKAPSAARSRWLSLAGAGAAVVLVVTGWSVETVVETAGDLDSSLEVCAPAHAVLSQGAHAQPTRTALREKQRKCPERRRP